MDPNATWSEMADAIQNDEWGRAGELADALTEWLVKGGFNAEFMPDKAIVRFDDNNRVGKVHLSDLVPCDGPKPR